MSRTTANLEHVGDGAGCIARSVQSIVSADLPAANIAECIIYVVSGTDVRHGGDGARGAAARH